MYILVNIINKPNLYLTDMIPFLAFPIKNIFFGVLFATLLVFALTGCAFKSVTRSKDITYLENEKESGVAAQKLNVFAPAEKGTSLKKVLIFIHGGNWNSGRKGLYSFLGNRLARKDVVTVIIDYPLTPNADYTQMALATARSVQWVSKNISKYGGDPNAIFISGHSAGGHLAALVAIDNRYFKAIDEPNPIKGVILIDAAGLDMYGYLKAENFSPDNTYLKTFTTEESQWKQASPLYALHPGMPPLLIYQGEKTYASISSSTERFIGALEQYDPEPNFYILKNKKHVGMITQFFNAYNPRYKEIIAFMNDNS